MSTQNWKLFVNKSQQGNSNSSMISSAKSGKYNPKKNLNNASKSPARFHNASVSKEKPSLSKNQGSIISAGDSMLDDTRRSFRHSASKMRNCASQLKLKKDDEGILKFNYGSEISDFNESDRKPKKEPGGMFFVSSYEKEIFKIKEQFAEFRSIIFRQLKRQEKNLKEMFEKVLYHLEKCRDFPISPPTLEKDYSKKQNSERLFTQQIIPDNHQRKISEDIDNFKFNLEINQPASPKVLVCPPKMMNTGNVGADGKESFEKFFTAMENLKKQMWEVSDMLSPKSSQQSNPFGWKRQTRTETRI